VPGSTEQQKGRHREEVGATANMIENKELATASGKDLKMAGRDNTPARAKADTEEDKKSNRAPLTNALTTQHNVRRLFV
jgi:hypothetical protein